MTGARLHLDVDPPLFADAIVEALGWDGGGDGPSRDIYVTDHDEGQADALVLPSPCGANGLATLRAGGRSLTIRIRDVSDLVKAVGLLARVATS